MQGPFVRGGKTLLSGIDPVRRAERTADAVPLKDRTLYFCPSPLFGYGLDRLLSRLEKSAPDSAILCIEADAELYELSIKNIDPSLAQNKMLRITNIREEAALCDFVRENWGARTFRRIETVRLCGGWQLFPELYDSLCNALNREIATDWGNAMTLAKLGRLYIRNFLRNVSLIPQFPSIEKLDFGSSPVLVLGAGPSLDETLDALELRYAQAIAQQSRPFRIICADTCLGALKDRNIVPDLVVILESQHWNLRDFTGCRGWTVPAAVDFSALSASTRVLDAGGFLFMTPWTHLKIFERLKEAGLIPSVIPPLGSVGLTAVEIARRVCTGKIICAGLDFSFNIDKYHARSTPGHRGKLNAQTRFRGITNTAACDTRVISAVSKSGVTVKTNPVMQNYRNLFEQEFGGDPRLFDIEGTGLPLGIKTLSMEDALSLLGERGEEREERRKKKEERGEREKLTGKVLDFLKGERERLEELRDILTGNNNSTPSRGVDEKKLNVPAQVESETCDESRLNLVSRARRGEAAARERLNVLVDECDYLWAHFPDYSGGRRPDLAENSPSALSFLKRVRAEIDPMVGLMERTIHLAT